MKVWIIERDHEPMLSTYQRTPAFRTDWSGTRWMKILLNKLQRDKSHYYDAVLYERLESPGAKRSRKAFEKWNNGIDRKAKPQ